MLQASLGAAHICKCLQTTFDLAQSHPPAVDLDQVIFPTEQGQTAIPVEAADVPGSQPAVAKPTADGYLATAGAQPDRWDKAGRHARSANPDQPGHAGGYLATQGIGGANLDAREGQANRHRISTFQINGHRTGLHRLVAGEQGNFESPAESLRHRRGERLARANAAGVARWTRLGGWHSRHGGEQCRRGCQDVSALLGQQLGQAGCDQLIVENQPGTLGQRRAQAEIEALAGVESGGCTHAGFGIDLQRRAYGGADALQLAALAYHTLGISTGVQGEKHDFGDHVYSERLSFKGGTSQQRAGHAATTFEYCARSSVLSVRRRCASRGRKGCQGVRPRDQRPQVGSRENHVEVASAQDGIKRHHDGVQLGEGKGQHYEVRNAAQHEANPVACLDAESFQLACASIDSMSQSVPREIGVPVDQGLAASHGSPARTCGVVKPFVQQRHACTQDEAEPIVPAASVGNKPQQNGLRGTNIWTIHAGTANL